MAAALYCTAKEFEIRAGVGPSDGMAGPPSGLGGVRAGSRTAGPLSGRPPLKWANKDGSTGYLTHEEYINMRRKARGETVPGGIKDWIAEKKAEQKGSPVTQLLGLDDRCEDEAVTP